MQTQKRTQKNQARLEPYRQREPEQKTACTPDNPPNLPAATNIPDSTESLPAAADDVISLEEIPVYLLGLNAIKQGAPIGRGGMSTVFNGKLGPTPVALKQAKGSVQTLLNEAQMITKMHHPNVIQVFGIWKNAQQQVFMVFVDVVNFSCRYSGIVVGIANLV